MRCDVLIVEDQEKIAQLVKDYLEAAGLRCQWRRNGMSLETDLADVRPRLVVLDLMLPGRDGLELCALIRQFADAAVIMLTARIEETERLRGFAAGADDYVCKPFSPRELVARVQAVLARTQARQASAWQAPPLHFDDELLEVRGPAGKTTLSAVQYRLLTSLARHGGFLWSRSQLIDAVHQDGRELNERTVDSHIRTLRRSLATIAPDTPLIETVYGAGYRFRAGSRNHDRPKEL